MRESMDAEIIEDTGKTFKFVLKKTTNNYANALRRAAINRVETFAIDKVTFYENTSVMFDEYIAHRIGLVPLTTPSKATKAEEVLFTLEASGPCTVYSKELHSSNKDVKVANPNIPIIKLIEGQQIRIEAKAVLGTALKHAKFQPGLVTFGQLNDDTFEFYVESFGQMPPREIVYKAIDAIKDELKELKKDVKK
jgi:DNA-directed RNA polymerase subunit D